MKYELRIIKLNQFSAWAEAERKLSRKLRGVLDEDCSRFAVSGYAKVGDK